MSTPPVQGGDGGANPTPALQLSPKELVVAPIAHRVAAELVRACHYLHAPASAVRLSLGVFGGGELFDPLHRTAWRKLLDDAAKRRFQAVLVVKLDRAFRSVKHMHDTLAVWEVQGIGFVSAREGFDTRTALGRLLLNLLASLAEFELEVLSERVKAGMDRARRQGVHVGRPPVTARPGFAERWAAMRTDLDAGRISRSEAGRRLGCRYATLLRLMGTTEP